MKKKAKVIIGITCGLVGALVLAVTIPFTILGIRTANLEKDYSYLKTDTNYANKVEVEGLELVTQHVSCGYASIEMISSYYCKKVTEDELDARNGAVSTASSKGFQDEISKCIPDKEFKMSSYSSEQPFGIVNECAQNFVDMNEAVYGRIGIRIPKQQEYTQGYAI